MPDSLPLWGQLEPPVAAIVPLTVTPSSKTFTAPEELPRDVDATCRERGRVAGLIWNKNHILNGDVSIRGNHKKELCEIGGRDGRFSHCRGGAHVHIDATGRGVEVRISIDGHGDTDRNALGPISREVGPESVGGDVDEVGRTCVGCDVGHGEGEGGIRSTGRVGGTSASDLHGQCCRDGAGGKQASESGKNSLHNDSPPPNEYKCR